MQVASKASAALGAVLAAAALGTGAGCGGGDGAQAQGATNSKPAAAGAISRLDLERQVGNAFDEGLGTIAAMSQPRDEAADLGQDVPTGTLGGVDCAPGGATCSVRWRTVGGRARTVNYRMRYFENDCFTAEATPQMPDPYDATTESSASNPLNSLIGTTCA